MLQQPPQYNFTVTRPHNIKPTKLSIKMPSILIGNKPFTYELNSILTIALFVDFTAMTLCDLIKTRKTNYQRSLPEFVFFVQKITHQADINVRTLLVALIYLQRAKANLPKRAVGSDGKQYMKVK